MKTLRHFASLPALSVLLAATPQAHAADAELEALRTQVQNLEQRLDATAAMAERASGGNTTLGGYGELHYNNWDSKKEIDFHRFVLFVGHRFSDTVRFHSELELEHSIASKSAKGEIELEQAYVELDVTPDTALRAGLFLIPVGILNETHEPPTFYGVERNNVEKNIIPGTWWEGGVALNGRLAPNLRYDLALTSGLFTTAAKDYKVRDGRQKVSEAKASDPAYTAGLRWSAAPGVELGGALHYQTDMTQGTESEEVSAVLMETHAAITRGRFGLRALFAQWNLDGNGPKSKGSDEQMGWYVEPSFRVHDKVGVFARYSTWDNKAGDAVDSEIKQADVGLNYWPHENVVFKADYQRQDGGADDGFSLGVGYQF